MVRSANYIKFLVVKLNDVNQEIRKMLVAQSQIESLLPAKNESRLESDEKLILFSY